jgi:Lon protease-like protein
MTQLSVPLFPLRTVLFPEGPLPLRVFEPRYLDMISRCMKTNEPFGVVLIAEGREAGNMVSTHAQGTLATITDWYQGDDGLLGITASGGERFRLLSMERQPDGLNVGKIEKLPPEPAMPVPADFVRLAGLLRAILSDGDIAQLYKGLEPRYDDASWVGYRFAEILPIELEQKQLCLEMDDPLERLEYLRPMLRETKQSFG